MVTLKAVVEALLFSSQKPLTAKEILQVVRLGTEYAGEEEATVLAKITEELVQEALQSLAGEYTELARSFQLVEQVSGWQLSTRPDYQIWVRQLFPELRPTRLSPPALETLAIVAYRQPITKGDIEAIRGVTVDGVMQKLLDLGLVKIAGRAEIPVRAEEFKRTAERIRITESQPADCEGTGRTAAEQTSGEARGSRVVRTQPCRYRPGQKRKLTRR